MNSKKETILIIDDSPINLQVLSAALTLDYGLQIAHSGATGLQVASRQPPDLILLDVMMPVMNGFEVCRRLKADPRLQHIPVIFLTAMDDSESETTGLSLGAEDYITKPINVDTARRRISNTLERQRLHREVQSHNEHLEEKVAARTMALSIAKEAVEASHRAKANFLNNMTHELRTPMTIIMGFNELALCSTTDPNLMEPLEKVQQASNQLSVLITSLMDITALESRQLKLVISDFTLGSVIDSVTTQLGVDAVKKGLNLSEHVAASLRNLRVQGDPKRLGQILLELIGNAIKYTPQGQVSLECDELEQTGKDIELRFTVRDTGIGIASADHRRIFNLFEQLDNTFMHHHSGAGLGLALCQQLIELMGGRFGLESQLGSGSAFWFSLRLPKAAVANPA